jgi:hypothetical protein
VTNVSDQRDLGAFIPRDLDDYGLDPFEFRVYARIVRRAGGAEGHYESAAHVAQAIGCGARKVREAYELLTLARLVRREKRPGRTDKFTLRPAAEWAAPATLDTLRGQARRPDHRGRTDRGPDDDPSTTAVPPTEVGPTAVPPTGHRGPTDRATAVGPTDEGTPTKGIPEGPPPPARDPDPPPPVDDDGGGGGGSADADQDGEDYRRRVRALEALREICRRLDEPTARRLLTDPPPQREDLLDALTARLDDGWRTTALARQLTEASFDRAGSIAAVLRARADRLAGVRPLASVRGPSDAGGIPPDVAAEIDKRADTEAHVGGGGATFNPNLKASLVARYRQEWLDQHQEVTVP